VSQRLLTAIAGMAGLLPVAVVAGEKGMVDSGTFSGHLRWTPVIGLAMSPVFLPICGSMHPVSDANDDMNQ
jgi:hypothetical protein